MGVQAKITVKLDGEEKVIDLNQDGDSILNAAIDAGLDAPFSCQGGVCTTCMAKVHEGDVVMDSNFALSDKELEEGYVLTCQGHPASEKVVLEYED